MPPSAQFAGNERRGGGASTRSPPVSSNSGGGIGRPWVAPPLLRLRLAWLWTCLLLLAVQPATSRELAPGLSLAVAEEAGVPTRRLQQACAPWPLSFLNENCNGTAAVTVRAQLGAPLPPGSAPCLNGASQPGEWCVRTVELRPGQQQLVFPQALNSTFQWYAELWGGNRTSPETPWYDVASGQPCEPQPFGNPPNFTTCKPFRQASAAPIPTMCIDPAARPIILQCNTTCNTRLLVANNCSLNTGIHAYGVLAKDVLPGFCVNNSTRRGEECITALAAYGPGMSNTGDNYAFDFLFHTGIYIYAAVLRTSIQWSGSATDPGVVSLNIFGERCTEPANATCLSFFQVAMDSSACGSTVTQTLTCPSATCAIPFCKTVVPLNGNCFCTECEASYNLVDYACLGSSHLIAGFTQLTGCMEVPYATLNASLGNPSCVNWATGGYVSDPCPAACDFGELPKECIENIVPWMLLWSKGMYPSNVTRPIFADSVLSACATGDPLSVDAVAAVTSDSLGVHASCGPAAASVVAASGCRAMDYQRLGLMTMLGSPDCDPECYTLLNNITLDCYVEYAVATAIQGGTLLQQNSAEYANTLWSQMNAFLTACKGQVGPSSSPLSPPSPDQPVASTTSSAGSRAPVAAIVGGVVGAVAAVAVCVLLVMALRRRWRRRQQLAGLAGKACDAFGPEGVDNSKATSSQALSLASSGSAGIGGAVPPALASDPLVSWIMASQPSSKARKGSGTSALRSQGSGSTQVQDWEIDWADLKLQRAVGSGSYGKVYLASWRTTPVAVKVLLVPGTAGANLATPGAAQEALALPPSALPELEAEAGLLASLRHPYCVYFCGLTRNPPALVTEYCSRGSVAELLDRARAEPAVAAELTWRRRLGMLLNAAEGMVYLHSHKRAPIIHRDFKSPNLLVDDSWRTKVTDFGLSRAMEDTALSSSVAVTNPRWLAPELMRGDHATQASDVFAFGVVMWEMLTWERPWAATNPWQISSAVLGGRRLEVSNPAALPGPAADSPEDFAAYVQLMQHCWAQAPGDRPSFPEVVQALRTMLGEEAPLGPADSV